MSESAYQTKLIKKLERMFPGCIIMKNDSTMLEYVIRRCTSLVTSIISERIFCKILNIYLMCLLLKVIFII